MNAFKEVKELLLQQLLEATEHAKWGNGDERAEAMEERHDSERARLNESLLDSFIG